MAKTIAVFCDGTWNSEDMDETTNVDEVFKACARTPTQVPVYIPGVGVDGSLSRIRRFVVKIMGGAFGWGLNERLLTAYRAIAEIYEPGDVIMLFGFSRGAYTARSLAGMIRKCGLLPKDNLGQFAMARALMLYKRGGKDNAPDMPHIMAARAAMSPDYATSQKDLEARADPGRVSVINVAYMGIWDTVGALGLPEPVLGPVARWWNKRYSFHDTNLSSMVKAARHTQALDEKRVFYQPIEWSNLEPYLDDDGTERLGLNASTEGAQRPYQQLWCVGNHSVLGGSSRIQGLVDISRDWVMDGAIERGLQIVPGKITSNPEAVSMADVGSESQFYTDLAPKWLEWRDGPKDRAFLHDSVENRIQARPEYRPYSLRRSRPDLF